MEQQTNKPKKTGPLKWGLVVMLVLGLGYVFFKPGKSDSPPVSAPPRGSQIPTADKKSQSNFAVQPVEPLPTVSVATVLNYNPFEFGGKREIASRTKVEKTATKTATKTKSRQRTAEDDLKRSLSQQVADIILESHKGRTARVGKMILHEGKSQGKGFIVRRIMPDQVDLEVIPFGGGRNRRGD